MLPSFRYCLLLTVITGVLLSQVDTFINLISVLIAGVFVDLLADFFEPVVNLRIVLVSEIFCFV